MAFTSCTNQFHFPKNARKGLKLVSTMVLKKWNTNSRLQHSVRKNKTTLRDVPLLPEIVVIHLLSNRIFRELFRKW